MTILTCNYSACRAIYIRLALLHALLCFTDFNYLYVSNMAPVQQPLLTSTFEATWIPVNRSYEVPPSYDIITIKQSKFQQCGICAHALHRVAGAYQITLSTNMKWFTRMRKRKTNQVNIALGAVHKYLGLTGFLLSLFYRRWNKLIFFSVLPKYWPGRNGVVHGYWIRFIIDPFALRWHSYQIWGDGERITAE